MRHPIRFAVALFGIVPLHAFADPPATGPASRPERSERARVIEELSRLPQSPPTPVAGLLSVRLGDGFLTVTATRGGDELIAVRFTDWPGHVFLGQTAGTDRLSMIHHAFAGAAETQTITQIESGAGMMTLSRDTEFATHVHSVQLIQNRTGNAGVSPVQLLVADTPGEAADADYPPRTRLTAATFAELCREHPDAVRRHLLPVFRDLKAEPLLQTYDAAMAWQVLGDEVASDPAMADRIAGLLKRADADDAAERTKASDELAGLGSAGAAELRRLDLAALPPEPRSAATDAIGRNGPLRREQATRMRQDVPFLVGVLRHGDARLSAAAAGRLATVTGRPIDLPAGLSDDERDRRIAAYVTSVMPTTRTTTRSEERP